MSDMFVTKVVWRAKGAGFCFAGAGAPGLRREIEDAGLETGGLETLRVLLGGSCSRVSYWLYSILRG